MTLAEFSSAVALNVICFSIFLYGRRQERKILRELEEANIRIQPALAILREDFDRLVREQKANQ